MWFNGGTMKFSHIAIFEKTSCQPDMFHSFEFLHFGAGWSEVFWCEGFWCEFARARWGGRRGLWRGTSGGRSDARCQVTSQACSAKYGPDNLQTYCDGTFAEKKSELSDSSNTCLRFSSATLRYQQDSMVTVRSPALLCWHVTHLTVVVLLLVDFYVLTL